MCFVIVVGVLDWRLLVFKCACVYGKCGDKTWMHGKGKTTDEHIFLSLSLYSFLLSLVHFNRSSLSSHFLFLIVPTPKHNASSILRPPPSGKRGKEGKMTASALLFILVCTRSLALSCNYYVYMIKMDAR